MSSKTCKNCVDFKIFYTKSLFMYWKEKKGICLKCEQIVNEKAKCKSFKLPKYDNEEYIYKLNLALNDILILQKIFNEV